MAFGFVQDGRVTYQLLCPPVGSEVLGWVGHAPEEGLAARDEVAQAARGEEEEGDDAEEVEDEGGGRVGFVVVEAVLGRLLFGFLGLLWLGLVVVGLDLDGFRDRRLGLRLTPPDGGFRVCHWVGDWGWVAEQDNEVG